MTSFREKAEMALVAQAKPIPPKIKDRRTQKNNGRSDFFFDPRSDEGLRLKEGADIINTMVLDTTAVLQKRDNLDQGFLGHFSNFFRGTVWIAAHKTYVTGPGSYGSIPGLRETFLVPTQTDYVLGFNMEGSLRYVVMDNPGVPMVGSGKYKLGKLAVPEHVIPLDTQVNGDRGGSEGLDQRIGFYTERYEAALLNIISGKIGMINLGAGY
ncbi:MAG: hypothetical protein WAW62_02725 [Candidatus Saccharimonas aalborgensis]